VGDDSIGSSLGFSQQNLSWLKLLVGVNEMKRTLRGSISKAKKGSGFLKRMSTKSGQNIIKARRAKGRYKLSV
jgi:large subunit ribosomal protein L34